MVKKIFKPIIFDIFSKKEQIATARTNSHGQAQIATACGGPMVPYIRHFILAGCYDNNPCYLVTNLAGHLDFAGHLDLAGFYFSKCPANSKCPATFVTGPHIHLVIEEAHV